MEVHYTHNHPDNLEVVATSDALALASASFADMASIASPAYILVVSTIEAEPANSVSNAVDLTDTMTAEYPL